MKDIFNYLENLSKNNNREWFDKHKPDFKKIDQEFKDFVKDVEEGMSAHDVLDTSSTKVFRIYRDVRFSKDKTPYQTHRSASFKRATAERRGGYYIRIKPNESAIVGGFFGPEAADMLHIRKQIQQAPDELREILASNDVVNYFHGLHGEQVKSAPRGFSKEDPAIDLLKYKQLLLKRDFTDEEVLANNFTEMVIEGFLKMRPFFDYMSDILTTDLNGEPLV